MAKSNDVTMKIPPCGGYCKNCVVYKKLCPGCIETCGKPFHIKKSGKDACPVYECATKHDVEHCGLCEEFPCEKYLDWYDPTRGRVTVLKKAGLLSLRKKIGTKKWVKWLKDKKIKFGV